MMNSGLHATCVRAAPVQLEILSRSIGVVNFGNSDSALFCTYRCNRLYTSFLKLSKKVLNEELGDI